jgi:vitamin B12 transport system substrate-binding protein
MIDAVKHQRLQLINSDELHRFTPRALNAVQQVCDAISPQQAAIVLIPGFTADGSPQDMA